MKNAGDAKRIACLVSANCNAGYHRGMQIVLNGESRDVEAGSSVSVLLAETGHAGKRVAVEVNRTIIPRGRHAEHLLAPGDRVEIVHAIGGG